MIDWLLFTAKCLLAFWAFSSVCTLAFYGLALLFIARHLSAEEVADRARDGRMFRDVFLPLAAFNWLELPGVLIAAILYPFVFTVRRTQLHCRRARFRKPCHTR